MIEPVHIKGPADMLKLAEEMRRCAIALPQDKPPTYHEAGQENEFWEHCEKEGPAYAKTGLNRVAVFHTPRMQLPVSLALTFEKDKNPHEWHLSMVMPGPEPKTFMAVPDQLARGIAIYLLGVGYREVPCEGHIIKEIRHFRKEAG